MEDEHEYAIHFPDFFREPMTSWYKAKTASKARYKCFLQFRDAYDMPFDEFLKIIKVWKMRQVTLTELP